MTILREVTDFLGEKRQTDVLELLRSPTLAWERSDLLGRTTSGRMWQLATSGMHRMPEMVRLSTLMASVVYEEIHRSLPELLPEPESLVPQVFPVRMEGNSDEPPTQWAHKDGAGGRHPIVTSLYYAQVDHAVGGTLVLHDDSGTECARVHPTADHLIIISGNQIHSVEPLTAGDRITIVTNFYEA
ncbi:2OG-Fe(II) oxygenase family protein [Prauserella flavalba]|uniref:2OG-Fe(II) oxygenase family protein n=1 Tax=Prauserella flavalba TaxID=1477506 RepID=UPI0036E1EF68